MGSSTYHHADEDFLRKLGAPAPQVETHGTETDIENNLRQVLPFKWQLSGNQLIGETHEGHRLVQSIPTDRVLVGTDTEGMPIFKKIKL